MAKSRLKVAVVGAGVMGLSASYALRGADVTLFDPKGFPADNASFMAGGMLAPWSEIEHLPEEFIEAGLRGIEIWQEALPELVRRSGSLIVAHRDDEYILQRLAQKLPQQKIIGAGEIAALESALGSRFEAGLYIKEEAHINPQQALAALAEKIPARIAESADIKMLQQKFDFVIDCRGLAADDKDLRGVKGEIVTVRNKEFSLSRPLRLMHPRYPLYIVPRADNMFMIGATLIESGDNTVTLKSALELLSAAYSLHPSFAESEIISIKAGIRPAYPDNLPRITVDGNIIRCNGLFRHGWLLAPVMAECVRDLVDGETNSFISLFQRSDDADHDQRQQKTRKLRA